MSEALEGAIGSELTAKRISKRTKAKPSSPVDITSAESTSEDGSLKSKRDDKVKSALKQVKFSKKTKSQKGKAIKANSNFKSPKGSKKPLRNPSPNPKQDLESLWSVDTSVDTIEETEMTSDEVLEDQERTTSSNPFSSKHINQGWEAASEAESITDFIYQGNPNEFSLDYDMRAFASLNYDRKKLGLHPLSEDHFIQVEQAERRKQQSSNIVYDDNNSYSSNQFFVPKIGEELMRKRQERNANQKHDLKFSVRSDSPEDTNNFLDERRQTQVEAQIMIQQDIYNDALRRVNELRQLQSNGEAKFRHDKDIQSANFRERQSDLYKADHPQGADH